MRPISTFVEKLKGIIDFDADSEWTDVDDTSPLSSPISSPLSSPRNFSSDTPPSLDRTGLTTPNLSSSSPAWPTPHRHIRTPTPIPRQRALVPMKSSWSWANNDDALFNAEAGGVDVQRDSSFENRVDVLRRELTQIARDGKDGG